MSDLFPPVVVHPLDGDQQALLAATRSAGSADAIQDLEAVRERLAAQLVPPTTHLPVVRDHAVQGPHGMLRLREYAHSDGDGRPTLIYFHGGGMVTGSLDQSDSLCRRLAAASGLAIFSVDYKLAPEHRFPVATDEAYFAAVWVAENSDRIGVDIERVAVGGDSAGGSLAAGVTLQARDNGGPKLALQLLCYPGLERVKDRPSMVEFGNGPGITREAIEWMKAQYLGPDPERDTPYGVPALASDLRGLPEAVLVVASADPLRDAVEEYASRLFDAGVPTTMLRYPGVVHGFLTHVDKLRRAQTCVADLAAVLAQRVARRQRDA